MAGEKQYCIYMHKNKINGKVYIGQTCQKLEQRWRHGEGYKANDHFYRAIKKYGWDNFEHIVLEDNLTLDEANIKEEQLIKQYNSSDFNYGYNLQLGGNNRVMHPETIEKIRQANIGKKVSDETRLKLKESHLGKKKTPEALENCRKAAAKHRGFNHGRSKPVMCIETQEIFGSSCEAERQYPQAHSRSIRAACTGSKGQQTAGGFHWRFLTQEEVEDYGRNFK